MRAARGDVNVGMSTEPGNGVRHVLLIPIYPPSPGGGAVYADLLTRGLVKEGIADEIEVITEYKDGQSVREGVEGDSVRVRRSLATFFTLEGRFAWRYVTYLIQCAQMLAICLRVGLERPSVVVFHASFFVHPSLNVLATRLLRVMVGRRTKIVLDVRDMGTPEKRLERLRHFDLAIGCSQRIVQKLSKTRAFSEKTVYVPVAVPWQECDPAAVEYELRQLGLQPKTYLLSANGIVNRKAFPALYDAWREVIQDCPGVDLVVAGPVLDWEPRYDQAHAGGRLIVLGSQPNATVRRLTSGAGVHVNPSPIEGVPRSTLEAMMANVPVLVPGEGVEEFNGMPERLKAPHNNVPLLAARIRALLEHPELAPYPMDKHNVEEVLAVYGRVLTDPT